MLGERGAVSPLSPPVVKLFPSRVAQAGAKGLMTGDLSSTNAAHEGKYGFELEVTDVYEEDYYGMLSLPAFLVTDHERMYTLTFWAKATGNPKPRPHVTFQVRAPCRSSLDRPPALPPPHPTTPAPQ